MILDTTTAPEQSPGNALGVGSRTQAGNGEFAGVYRGASEDRVEPSESADSTDVDRLENSSAQSKTNTTDSESQLARSESGAVVLRDERSRPRSDATDELGLEDAVDDVQGYDLGVSASVVPTASTAAGLSAATINLVQSALGGSETRTANDDSVVADPFNELSSSVGSVEATVEQLIAAEHSAQGGTAAASVEATSQPPAQASTQPLDGFVGPPQSSSVEPSRNPATSATLSANVQPPTSQNAGLIETDVRQLTGALDGSAVVDNPSATTNAQTTGAQRSATVAGGRDAPGRIEPIQTGVDLDQRLLNGRGGALPLVEATASTLETDVLKVARTLTRQGEVLTTATDARAAAVTEARGEGPTAALQTPSPANDALSGVASLSGPPARGTDAASLIPAASNSQLTLHNNQVAIEQSIRLAIARGLDRASIELEPADLGRVDISIVRNGDEVQVSFKVSQAQSRDLIEASIGRLREGLSDAGLSLTESSVDDTAQDSDPQARSDRTASASIDDDAATDPELVSAEKQTLQAQSLVDIRV